MISRERAIDILGEMATRLVEDSEEHQALCLAAHELFHSESGAVEFYSRPDVRARIDEERTAWISIHPEAQAGTTVLLCGVLHVVSFLANGTMQLSPVFLNDEFKSEVQRTKQ